MKVLSRPEPEKRSATYADPEAVPEELVGEIIDGELVTRRGGIFPIAKARTAITMAVGGRLARSTKHIAVIGRPELHHCGNVLVPDVAAWPEAEMRFHLDSDWRDVPAPYWFCDVVASSMQDRHLKARARIYGEAGIPLMWIVDPRQRKLEAFELASGQWLLTGSWNSDDSVSAKPFDAINFSLADLWPLDKPLGFAESPQHLFVGDR